MAREHLNKIKLLQEMIESALKKSDFEKLASLSNELESSVKNIAKDPLSKTTITQEEVTQLRILLQSVEKYQHETSLKFKNYTQEVSRKRKMHQAYKQ